MSAVQDFSFFSLILHASLLAKSVLIILILASLRSWTLIFKKSSQLKQTLRYANHFEQKFWKGQPIAKLYQQTSASHNPLNILENIFVSGMQEYMKAKERNLAASLASENARRSMIARYQREMNQLEENLSSLATIGSVSPYIGLFGTVWGVMSAFQGLANVQQTTLTNVAPGIAEALIATAIGLFAAIPAVVAYNRFTHKVDHLSIQCETFIEELTNILQRQTV